MTTNPIPPEALTGCECLVWTEEYTLPLIGKCRLQRDWVFWNDSDCEYHPERCRVTRAIPFSWCLAAPGMREALNALYNHPMLDRAGGVEVVYTNMEKLARAALAACDGKGE